jgi:hypothetical protein
MKAIARDKIFLSRTQVVQQLRERTNKWDYMKLKSFCTAKEMVSKWKRPATEREKIFSSYISDKGLPKNQLPNKETGNQTEQNIFKGRSPNCQKTHGKKCSPSLALKEMQIKTTLRFHHQEHHQQ